MSAATIQSQLNTVFNAAGDATSSAPTRYALLFKPGTYNVDVNVGFYTQVAGLGLLARRGDHQRRGARRGRLVPAATRRRTSGADAENLSVDPDRRHRPLGGVAGGAVPPHARARQPRARRRRLVQRRLHLRLEGRRAGQLRLAAAVDLAQHAVGQLDRLQLEHGLRRRRRTRPANTLPQPAVHHRRRRPRWCGRSRSCTSTRRRLPGVRAGAADQHARGTTWASGTAGRAVAADQPVLHRQGRARPPRRINAALAAGKNLLFTPGVYHLNDTHPDHPAPTPSCSASAWPRSSRTTASPR